MLQYIYSVSQRILSLLYVWHIKLPKLAAIIGRSRFFQIYYIYLCAIWKILLKSETCAATARDANLHATLGYFPYTLLRDNEPNNNQTKRSKQPRTAHQMHVNESAAPILCVDKYSRYIRENAGCRFFFFVYELFWCFVFFFSVFL